MPGFQVIDAAFQEADLRANRLSAIHRSQQLSLIVVAVLAVLIGALPILAPEGAVAYRTHLVAAGGELVLALFAFTISHLAAQARRHRRWSDARRLAERLRATRALWPLGADIADVAPGQPQTWTEWRARAVLRAAGPPSGWLDGPGFRGRVQWAASEMIGGQIRYHHKEQFLDHGIERRIRRTEEAAFVFLIFTLALYLVTAGVLWLARLSMPPVASGLVAVISATSPAVAAACLGLEATNAFGELALRSGRLLAEYRKRAAELADPKGAALHHAQDVLRSAGELLVEDADSWRDRLESRRIVRG
jgi:hypothetical protein